MKTYRVGIAGIEHTMRLSDEEAKAHGLTPIEDEPKAKAAEKPANKARKSTTNKSTKKD